MVIHFAGLSDAQIVIIPDTAFLQLIIEEGPDINGDTLICKFNPLLSLDISRTTKIRNG
jgi:hypothetical protein